MSTRAAAAAPAAAATDGGARAAPAAAGAATRGAAATRASQPPPAPRRYDALERDNAALKRRVAELLRAAEKRAKAGYEPVEDVLRLSMGKAIGAWLGVGHGVRLREELGRGVPLHMSVAGLAQACKPTHIHTQTHLHEGMHPETVGNPTTPLKPTRLALGHGSTGATAPTGNRTRYEQQRWAGGLSNLPLPPPNSPPQPRPLRAARSPPRRRPP